jgi:hypothetical protein
MLIKIINQGPDRPLGFARRWLPATEHRDEPIEGALAGLKMGGGRRWTVTSRQVRI